MTVVANLDIILSADTAKAERGFRQVGYGVRGMSAEMRKASRGAVDNLADMRGATDREIEAQKRWDAATEKNTQHLSRLNNEIRERNALAKSFGRDRYEVGMPKELQGATTQANKLRSAVLGISGPLIAAGVGVGTLRKAFDNAVEIENAQATFRALIGNAQQAQSLIGNIRQISATTPLTFGGTLDAARTMLLFNVQLKDVMPNLEALGNITGGNVERMKSLALAFSQATAAGRLQGQDLRQMIDAGFNPLQHIAKETGEDLETIRDRLSQLGGAEEMTKAFRDAGSELNLLNEMSETLGGQLAVIGSKLEVISGEVGQNLSPVVFELGSLFERWEGPIQDAVWLTGKLGEGLSFLIAMQSDLFDGWKRMVTLEPPTNSAIVQLLDGMNAKEAKRRREIAQQNNQLEKQASIVNGIAKSRAQRDRSIPQPIPQPQPKPDQEFLSQQKLQAARAQQAIGLLAKRRDQLKEQIGQIESVGNRRSTPTAGALQRGTVEAYSAARRNEQNKILAKSAAQRNRLLETLNGNLEQIEARIARLGTIGSAG